MADTEEKKLSKNVQDIADKIKALTIVEVNELASYLEDEFGVSAMPVMAAGAPGTAPAAAEEPAEEKTEFNVVLTEAGAQKLAVIKAVRELKPDLGLIDAKKLVESAPQNILENAKKGDADKAKEKLEAAGAKAELK